MAVAPTLLQLIRAHYLRDDAGFTSAATALARSVKTDDIKRKIQAAIAAGHSRSHHSPGAPAAQHMRPLPPAQSQSSLLEPLRSTTFANLMYEPELQAQLDEIVTELEYRDELAARKLRARNRLLFWGPPGNGKTSGAAALAHALEVPAFGVSLPKLISKYIGETGQNIGELFTVMGANSVVVFDEIDAIGSKRANIDQSAGKEQNSSVNTLLTLLDRHQHGVLVATTNRPDILDPALLRRFDEQIEFPAASALQMRSLAEKLCDGYGVPVCDVSGCQNFDGVAKTCETQARRHVMKELLAADGVVEDDDDDETAPNDAPIQ